MEDNIFSAYDSFTAKFERKKTTDDCYTPEPIMEVVNNYVARRYGRDASRFVRPFFPDKDYKTEAYPDSCTVVDNPPFSILSAIIDHYQASGVPFFLFGPKDSVLQAVHKCAVLCVDSRLTFLNGASININFFTNLEPAGRLRNDPGLRKDLALADFKANPRKATRPHVFHPCALTLCKVLKVARSADAFEIDVTAMKSSRKTYDFANRAFAESYGTKVEQLMTPEQTAAWLKATGETLETLSEDLDGFTFSLDYAADVERYHEDGGLFSNL